MELIRREVPNDFNIFLFGDGHLGSMMHYDDGWEQLVDMMHSEYEGCKHNIGVDHGDCIEAIKTDDPRFQYDVTPHASILAQAQLAKQDRTAIAPLLAAILKGNHEEKLHRFGELTRDLIAGPLDVPYGTYSCKITYHDKKGREILKHFAFHGAGSINSIADDEVRRESNMQLSLKRKLKKKAGDTALMSMGHTHKLIVTKPAKTVFLTDDGESIKQHYTASISLGDYIHPDHRWYVNTGSFMRLYGDMGFSGYAEIAGYDPIMLGFVVAMVRDRKLVDAKKVFI